MTGRSSTVLWTPEEVAILREHYSTATFNVLLRLLPQRTPWAIRRKARELRVSGKPSGRNWTMDEDAALLAGGPAACYGKIPGRTILSIDKRWERIRHRHPEAQQPRPAYPAREDCLPAHMVQVHRPVGTWELPPEHVRQMAKARPFEALEPA